MALARLSIKAGSRGHAALHASYIARVGKYATRLDRGERLTATGSGNMPAWAVADPVAFWAAADACERKNGSPYREMEIALPRELPASAWISMTRDWVAQELGTRHAYQWAIHVPVAADGGSQPHVHLMFSERQVDGIERDPEQYFRRYNAKSPEKGGARKLYGNVPDDAKGAARRAARVADLRELRGRWEAHCNSALERAGLGERIDMRSYRDRGLTLVPAPERKMLPSQWRDPAQRQQILEYRAAAAELRAANDSLHDLVPHPGKVIQMEAWRAKRADQTLLETMSLPELQDEVQRRAVPTFEALAWKHPRMRPIAIEWTRAQGDDDALRHSGVGEERRSALMQQLADLARRARDVANEIRDEIEAQLAALRRSYDRAMRMLAQRDPSAVKVAPAAPAAELELSPAPTEPGDDTVDSDDDDPSTVAPPTRPHGPR